MLAAAMILTLTGFTYPAETAAPGSDYGYYVNPIYNDYDFPEIPSGDGIMTVAEPPVFDSIEECAGFLEEGLKNRASSTTFVFSVDTSTVSDLAEYLMVKDADGYIVSGAILDILRLAQSHTGDPKEGDYIRYTLGNCSFRYEFPSYTVGGMANVTLTYTPTYYTTVEQEAEMDKAVRSLLDGLKLDGLSDYGKIKAIYDWICKNVTYDYANLNDNNYKLKFTPYAALINRTAVCQGYATLFYRLALEEGIDARVIGGQGNGGAHGWNIVKICDRYFNLDSTWDASRYLYGYNYFLKCNKTFTKNYTDHFRYTEFSSAQFNASYPMSEADFNGTEHFGQLVAGEDILPTCGKEGYKNVKVCSSCNKIADKGTPVPATGKHTWRLESELEPPTCQKEGRGIYVCTVCAAAEEQPIPTVGHDYSAPDGTCKYCGEKPDVTRGDVNGDGNVSLADAILTLQRSLDLNMTDTFIEEVADMNGDGTITLADAIIILQISLDII